MSNKVLQHGAYTMVTKNSASPHSEDIREFRLSDLRSKEAGTRECQTGASGVSIRVCLLARMALLIDDMSSIYFFFFNYLAFLDQSYVHRFL